MFNTITYLFFFFVYLFTFGNICTLTGSYHFGKDNAAGSPAVAWGGFRGFISLSLFFLFQASKMRRFARVLSHGAPNNCHQVQSGNGPLEMRHKKKSPRSLERLRLGAFLSWFQRGYPSVQAESTVILCWRTYRNVDWQRHLQQLCGKGIWLASLFLPVKLWATVD